MRVLLLPGVFAFGLLGGCNSESPEPAGPTAVLSTTAPPVTTEFVHFEGIWQGIVTPDASGTSLAAVVMVNGWGEFRLVADGMQLVGFPRRTTSSIAGEVKGITSAETTWPDGSRVKDFTLGGTISDDEFIEAEFNGSGAGGALAVAWATTDYPTEIQWLNGVWAAYDENQNLIMTLQIEVSGIWLALISGAHSNGCVYSGLVEAWTSQLSYDLVPFEVSGCPITAGIDPNGTYSGIGGLIDIESDDSDEPVLVIALSNDVNQIAFFLHRLPG